LRATGDAHGKQDKKLDTRSISVLRKNGGDNVQVNVCASLSNFLDDSETIPVGGRQKSPCRAFASAAQPLWRFGGPGAGRPCDDIVKHTRDGVETLVRLGEP
jgi:hypothetical protein